MGMYENYEGFYALLESVLDNVKNPENKEEVENIVSMLNSDILYDEPIELIVSRKLKEIGEEELAATYIYPLISELAEGLE